MPNVESHSFRALGNAVNTKVVSEIMKEIIKQKNSIHKITIDCYFRKIGLFVPKIPLFERI